MHERSSHAPTYSWDKEGHTFRGRKDTRPHLDKEGGYPLPPPPGWTPLVTDDQFWLKYVVIHQPLI